jgi:hypothetical protein
MEQSFLARSEWVHTATDTLQVTAGGGNGSATNISDPLVVLSDDALDPQTVAPLATTRTSRRLTPNASTASSTSSGSTAATAGSTGTGSPQVSASTAPASASESSSHDLQNIPTGGSGRPRRLGEVRDPASTAVRGFTDTENWCISLRTGSMGATGTLWVQLVDTHGVVGETHHVTHVKTDGGPITFAAGSVVYVTVALACGTMVVWVPAVCESGKGRGGGGGGGGGEAAWGRGLGA